MEAGSDLLTVSPQQPRVARFRENPRARSSVKERLSYCRLMSLTCQKSSIEILLLLSSERSGRDCLNDREIDCQQDRDNHTGHNNEDQWFKKRRQLLEANLSFCVIEACYF